MLANFCKHLGNISPVSSGLLQVQVVITSCPLTTMCSTWKIEHVDQHKKEDMGTGCSCILNGQMLAFLTWAWGFQQVSEAEGHVKCGLGSGQLPFGQQELLSDTAAYVSSSATTHLNVVWHLMQHPKPLSAA